MGMEQDPEDFWADVLSGEPAKLRGALSRLSTGEKAGVVAHLRRMASEAGWQAAQRMAARAALKALGEEAAQRDGRSIG